MMRTGDVSFARRASARRWRESATSSKPIDYVNRRIIPALINPYRVTRNYQRNHAR
jgi:hypothetical protein